MWGYLTEFWDNVSGSTIDAWEFTATWFQNVGNAVAGAVGNLFFFALRSINDFVVLIGWFFELIKTFFQFISTPFIWVIHIISAFFSNVGLPPTDFSYTWNTDVLSVFQAIPYWSYISLVIGIVITLIGLRSVLNALSKL